MAISTAALFYCRDANRLFTSDYTDWAVAMLVQGHDTPNLRILAGLDSAASVFEADERFLRAAREMGLRLPGDTPQNLRAYACELAQAILDGLLEPESGVRQLFRLCSASGYAPDMMIWLYLDDALDSLGAGDYPYTYEAATVESFPAWVRVEAAKFIAAQREALA